MHISKHIFCFALFKATMIQFDEIIAYDNTCYIQPDFKVRRSFLHRWINVPDGLALAASSEGTIVGYGCRRPCIQENEHMIGPLYADNQQVAEVLLLKLCEDIQRQNVTIIIW